MNLPSGWVETTLGQIGRWGSGGTPKASIPSYYGGAIPWIRSGDLPDDEIIRHEATITEDGLKSSSAKWVDPDSVLIAMYGATIGKVGITTYPITTNQAVAFVKPHESIDPRYVFRYLQARKSYFIQLGQGGAQPNISQEIIKAQTIPVPPLAEQRRIVIQLDALFARLARARAELDRVLNLSKKACEGLYSQAFSPFNEHVLKLGSVLEDIRYGTAKKCDYGDGVPVLRIPNIASGRISIEDLKRAHFEADELTKLYLRRGDVLVIRSNGSRDLVGRSAVVDDAAAGMLYAGYLIRLRLDESKLLPDYLHAYLSSPSARQTIEALARSTSGVNNINAEQLKALMVPAPTLEAQRSVISAIRSANAHTNRLEFEASRARALLDRLEAAILRKAFKGELVPQDPNDEPATALLERIKVAQAQELRSQPKRGRNRDAPTVTTR